MRRLLIVSHLHDWDFKIAGLEVVTAKSYLTEEHFFQTRATRVYNMCRSYRYQSAGYYVSLLAEARGHRVFPSIVTLQDIQSSSLTRILSDDIDAVIQKSLRRIKSKDFILSIYFEKNMAKQYETLCRKLSKLFYTPCLRARFTHQRKWILQDIRPIAIKDISEDHKPFVMQCAKDYFSRKVHHVRKRKRAYYDLAILCNTEETAPPSDKKALQLFAKAAEDLDFDVEFITKDDIHRIAEFDALFIRETTSVNHHTYRCARRAAAEGLVVIDSPESIVKCTNKVYLAELLTKAKVPIPKTRVIHQDNIHQVLKELGTPCVLKAPDSSFSQGVEKVMNSAEFLEGVTRLLEKSEFIIAQEFSPTSYDWRIGVLDRKPLYACKYYMAKDHWQIYHWQGDKESSYGHVETFALSDVPGEVVQTAVKAANLIGDSLYGVDIKMIREHAVVIEVNDNPSIEFDDEDRILREELYQTIMLSFVKRIEAMRKGNNGLCQHTAAFV